MTSSFSKDSLDFTRADMPEDFQFGVAASSYQIEGSRFGGCGRSHWDDFAATPGNTARGEDGSLACDHYHRWADDLDLIRDAGLDCYRFRFPGRVCCRRAGGSPMRKASIFTSAWWTGCWSVASSRSQRFITGTCHHRWPILAGGAIAT